MQEFTLFHPYPLTGFRTHRHPFDQGADFRQIETISTPLEMLDHSFKNYTGSSLIGQFDQLFEAHRKKMYACRVVPAFQDIPAATRFQRSWLNEVVQKA